jgi:hypothetical protein
VLGHKLKFPEAAFSIASLKILYRNRDFKKKWHALLESKSLFVKQYWR